MKDREHIRSARVVANRAQDGPCTRLVAGAVSWLDVCIPGRVHEAGSASVSRARVVLVAAFMAGAGAALIVLQPHTLPQWRWIAPGITLAMALTPLWLRLTGSVALAANYVVCVVFVAVMGLAVAAGGRDPVSLYGSVLIPSAAALLCGFRAGVLWSAATLLAVGATWAATAGGYEFPLHPIESVIVRTRFPAVLHTLVPIVVVSLTYEWLNRRAVTEAEHSNAALARQSSRQEAVASVGVFALATSDSKPAVDCVLRILVQHLDLQGAEILRFGDGDEIERVGSCGTVPGDVADTAAHVDRVVAAGCPVILPVPDGRHLVIADAISGRDRTWGVLVGHMEPSATPCAADRHFVRSLCNLVAVVWDREAQASREETTRSQLQMGRQLESIGQLAAGIAHEINTPAQYVGDNVQFLKEGFGDLNRLVASWREALGRPQISPEELAKACEAADLDWLLEEVPQALEQSEEGIRRVSEIVQAMRQFSHPGQTEKTPTDLNAAIRNTVTVSRNEWKYAADLDLDLDPSLPLVCCEASHMNQVFLNLIVNAAQAMPPDRGQGAPKGRIAIRTGHEPGRVWIEVADDGVGLPPEVRSRIFDPFFTTKDPGKGTGQGLAIARSYVVERHGGHIDVASEPGCGATFRVELPIPTEDAV